jgi:photosystem II stability/assembly factor-like uncharacterized protein
LRYYPCVLSRAALCLSLGLVATGGLAHADGGIPDELQIFLPPARPHTIIATTTFGLLTSSDDGRTWQFVCELAISSTLVSLYQVGPPPDNAVYAAALAGLRVSRDDACTWGDPGGKLAGGLVPDLFPDPSNSNRVLAIARPLAPDGGMVPMGLFESSDGGRTFPNDSLYTDPQDGFLDSVEIAATAPKTVYLTFHHTVPTHPYLARTTDGGQTWTTLDEGALGAYVLRILQVDPNDAQTAYLRAQTTTGGDRLYITHDGGTTLRMALELSDPTATVIPMSAFLLRSDGALMVGTRSSGGKISTDGGQTFGPWPGAPHLRALAERAGAIYAAGDNVMDNFAIGVSHDKGATFSPVLTFDHICPPKACGMVQSACASTYQGLVELYSIPNNVCAEHATDASTTMHSGGCSVASAARGALHPGFVIAPLAGVGLGLTLAWRAASRRSARRRRG